MNEWEFTALVASWVNGHLAQQRTTRFAEARCEGEDSRSRQRRDFTLLDRSLRPVLTGEVKLPYQRDGATPYNAAVVRDARKKARRANARFFFTWNVNTFVLWETERPDEDPVESDYRSWQVVEVRNDADLQSPLVQQRIGYFLAGFLHDFDGILAQDSLGPRKSPDEKFVEQLEAALARPIILTVESLARHCERKRFKADLDAWMREVQGWVIDDHPTAVRENLERSARSACYALVNKLVFHEALLKRYGRELQKLDVPEHVDTGEGLLQHLELRFADARRVTKDYETVFGESQSDLGCRIPFYADDAVPLWRGLIEEIRAFDFSRLDYEVVGGIFERLIGPEERHKYGQFYTRVEVVDLVNSFAIRTPDATVLDPACGGGTFLVRAYARKRELALHSGQPRNHGELLSDLFGIDVLHFATHLTVINLATRDLIDEENYPRVVREDFFSVEPKDAFMRLPTRLGSVGLGAGRTASVSIPLLDAVVGNPPYVRQEDIRKAKFTGPDGSPEPGTKEFYAGVVAKDAGVRLPGRSDLHCYFWPHAASFLKPDGYLCLLTSSQWLDVEYGFRLQDWILRNFEIVAVFESLQEPWFVGARVVTAATILRRQPEAAKRMANVVRFVQLQRPMAELLEHDGTVRGAMLAADALRDEILALRSSVSNNRYRARLVPQATLWRDGVALGVLLGKTKRVKGAKEVDREIQSGTYYGGKWGMHVRAPDLWFELVERHADRFVRFVDVAKIWFGVKSGKDEFFFPVDCSVECLTEVPGAEDFREDFGVARRDVESGKVRLVRCGPGRGEVRPLEARFLEPEVHSLMEVDGFVARAENCRRRILLVGLPKKKIGGLHVGAYVDWGERQGYHRGSTCAARENASREWYDLTGHERGRYFWPMAQQYKHAIPANDEGLVCNHNLFDVSPIGCDDDVLGGVLNSSFVVLAKFQYGRPVGVEGNFKTEIVDVEMMRIPDPRSGTEKSRRRVAEAFERMKSRPARQFLSERRMRQKSYESRGKAADLRHLSDESELDLPDRHALDDAVLQMIGVRSKEERWRILLDLYSHLRRYFEDVRQKEEIGIDNKQTTSRRGSSDPRNLARLAFDDLHRETPALLRQYDPDIVDAAKPYDAYELPAQGTAEAVCDLYDRHGVRFRAGRKDVGFVKTRYPEQDALVVLVANSGIRGFIRVPYELQECRRVEKVFRRFLDEREARLKELVAERTGDEDLQQKVLELLRHMVNHPHGV